MRESIRERRSSKASAFPLAVLAAVFVLPTYSSCGNAPESPAQYASDGPFLAFWIAPVFLCAAVLAALTFRSLRRGEVDNATRRLGLISVAGFALSLLGAGTLLTLNDGEWGWLAVALVPTLAAGALVRRARGMTPWRIWEHLLAAFTLLALATPASLFIGGDLLQARTGNLGPGAWLYAAALLSLCGILGVAVARARR